MIRKPLLLGAVAAAAMFFGADLIAGTIRVNSPEYWTFSRQNGWQKKPPKNSGNPSSSGNAGNSGASLGASLSGFVWYDADKNGKYGGHDSPMHGALMVLYSMKDLKHALTTIITDSQGKYSFGNLAPGKYALALSYPQSPGGKDCVGKILDQYGKQIRTGTGTLLQSKDMIVDIVLGKGYKAENYNFGEVTCPVSKREFVATPEPGAIALLASAAIGGGLLWSLRRRNVKG